MSSELQDISEQLIAIGRRFDTRGWVLGTSGNFSAVISRDPLRLAITASGTQKGNLTGEQILEIDGDAAVASPRFGQALRGGSPPRRAGPQSRRGRSAPHPLDVEHVALRSARHDGRPRDRGVRDAEGSRGRDDARTCRVDSGSRERSGHDAARRRGANDARRSSGRARIPSSPSWDVHLGRHAAAGRAPRRNRRVPARSARACPDGDVRRRPSHGRVRAAIGIEGSLQRRREHHGGVKIPADNKILDETEAVTAFLAAHGIDYEQWPSDRVVDGESTSETLLAAVCPGD